LNQTIIVHPIAAVLLVQPGQGMKRNLWKPILNIVGWYALFGALWIALTDPLLHFLVPNPDVSLRLEIYKGWFYILATAILLSILLYRQLNERAQILEDLETAHNKLTVAYHDLQAGEDRFRATFEQSAVGIAYTAVQGQMVLFNHKWLQLLDRPAEQLYDLKFQQVVHPEDAGKYSHLMEMVKAHPDNSESAAIRLISGSGLALWVNLVLTYIRPEEPESGYWILVINDIDRLVNAERELRSLNDELETRVEHRTSQLKKANQELESFAYSISHDLRAPLRAISGYSSILLSDYREKLDSDGQTMIDNIHNSSTRMNEMIDDLLRYARLGNKSLVLRPIHVKDVFAEMEIDYGKRIEELGANVTLPEGEDPGSIYGDPTLLHQIFTNLLDNALKYQPPGRQPKINIQVESTPTEIITHFKDNGIGIAPEHFDRIFNIFQRLHSTDEYPGTGIGLAIVKKAVDMMSGTITVESIPGEGTCFTIHLNKYREDLAGG
jgi:PAS domain S-box-containing protein